jgi:hypothetical protein
MKQSFERRFAEAVRRRLYPNSTLRLKMVSQDTGYSEDTIARWMQGKHRVFAGAVEDMASYFATRYGDHGLLGELFEVPSDRKIPLLTAGERREVDLCLWATEEAMLAAAGGHELFVRNALGLSPAADQDLVRYAVTNLGWVAGIVYTDGRLLLRYAPKTLDAQVAFRLRDWLVSEGRRLTTIQVVTTSGSNWSLPTSLTMSDAVRLFDRHAARGALTAALGETSWKVERESLDALAAGFRDVVAMVGRGDPMRVAVGNGLIGTSSLFSVQNGSDVVSLYIGDSLGLPVERFAHRNVLDRDDARYAALVHRHVLECLHAGPTLYHLEIDIAGRRRHYRRLAVPAMVGNQSTVLTTSELLDGGTP